MIKISVPIDTINSAMFSCISNIIDVVQKRRVEGTVPDMVTKCSDYIRLAQLQSLYTIPFIANTRTNPEVIGDVTKDELNQLYNYYMVQRPAGRAIYDRIKVSSKEHCPFCGGIGRAINVDHFLPKANYPQYSVFPGNLIPVCRDCNTGKGNKIFPERHLQPLHPYYDPQHYFLEKWVVASIYTISPLTIIYTASPPENWNPIDSERVRNHFKEFELAIRYSLQARGEISTIISQRRGGLSFLNGDQYKSYLISAINSDFHINHWKSALYHCLANDERITHGHEWYLT